MSILWVVLIVFCCGVALGTIVSLQYFKDYIDERDIIDDREESEI